MVGFGFLIPIFIVSGVRFDLSGLLASPLAMVMLPVLLFLFLLTRGAPVALLYWKVLDAADLRALALFAATALPLVVAITNIGVQTGRLREDLAAALIGAAMASVAVLPLLALRSHRRATAGLGSDRLGPAIKVRRW